MKGPSVPSLHIESTDSLILVLQVRPSHKERRLGLSLHEGLACLIISQL